MKAHGSWLTWIVLLMVLVFSSLCAAQTQGEENEDSRWFVISTLNEGLDEAPDDVRRATPRESIRSFLRLTNEEKFAEAAHTLNLNDLSAEEQQNRGALLTRQLAEVLRRGVSVHPTT